MTLKLKVTNGYDGRYPHLYRATLTIALENRGINRGRSRKDQRTDFGKWVRKWASRHLSEELASVDRWLGTLDEETFSEAATGTRYAYGFKLKGDMVFEGKPSIADMLLDDYFDEYC